MRDKKGTFARPGTRRLTAQRVKARPYIYIPPFTAITWPVI
jgi:hypothetical protein